MAQNSGDIKFFLGPLGPVSRVSSQVVGGECCFLSGFAGRKNGLVMLAFLIYRLPIMRKRLGWMFTQCLNRITPLKKSIKFLQKE